MQCNVSMKNEKDVRQRAFHETEKSTIRLVHEHPLDVALNSYGTRVRCIYLSKAPPSSPVVKKGQ